MKTVKLVSMAILCVAISLVSCSGEDGEKGMQGDQGVQGEPGPQGEQGEPGNANVQLLTFDLADVVNGDYQEIQLELSEQVEDPSKYSYLFYLGYPIGDDVFHYSIPGPIFNNSYNITVVTNFQTGFVRIFFFDANDDPIVIPEGTFSDIKVIVTEITTTAKNSEDIMSELKAAGVDTSDYNAVAEYFGLE